MKPITGKGLNDFAYFTANEAEQIYTIVDIARVRDKRLIGTVLVRQRLVNDQVIIELDRHDKLLVDALTARGVPGVNRLFSPNRGRCYPLFNYGNYILNFALVIIA